MKQQKSKLELQAARVKARERTLFESCNQAIERKDPERVKIFGAELREVKKVSNAVNNGILHLEQLTLRMETIKDVGSCFAQLGPTLEVVRQISSQLGEVMPEVSHELSSIGSILDEALVGMNIDLAPCHDLIVPESNLGEEILEQASSLLRSKIEEELPVPPMEEYRAVAPAIIIGGEEELESVSLEEESGANFKVVTNVSKSISSKEEAVLFYLRSNDGEFDLEECSCSCKIPESEITSIIHRLSRKGMIKIMTV